MTSLPSRWPSVEDGEMLRASLPGAASHLHLVQPLLLPQPMYTRSQALQRLTMGCEAFATCVAQGYLQKVPVGSGRYSVYYQVEVDALAEEIRAGVERSCLQQEVIKQLHIGALAVAEHVAAGRLRTLALPAHPVRYLRDDVAALVAQRQQWLAQFTAVASHEAMSSTDVLTFLRIDKRHFSQYVASGEVQVVLIDGRKRGYRTTDVEALAHRLQQKCAVAEDTYSRAQACQVLGLTPNGFQYYLSVGRIRRTMVPGSQVYGYLKTDVDALFARTVSSCPDESVYTQFYTLFEPRAMKYFRVRRVPLADAQDLFQTVMTELWEYGAVFFATNTTLDEQFRKGYRRLHWAFLRSKSVVVPSSLEQEIEGVRDQPALQLRHPQPSVEQEVLGRLELEQVRAYCQQRFPAVVGVIVELAAMGYNGKAVLMALGEHYGLDLSLRVIERWRGQALRELRAHFVGAGVV